MNEYEALLPGESGQAASIRNLGDSQADGEWEKIYVKEARLSGGLCATDGTSLVSPSELRQHLDNHPSSTGGASSFAGLTDTPANFIGASGKFAVVKTDESGLEFIEAATGGSSGGASSFVGLSDTPTDFSGAGGKIASVKNDESGIEFISPNIIGTGGASSFSSLSDTPADFSGAGGMFAVVKSDESGLEFTAPPASGTGGTSDHGLLLGLANDDHPQYYNQARGDARYAFSSHSHGASDLNIAASDIGAASNLHTHGSADLSIDLSSKADLTHTHGSADLSIDLSNKADASHTHTLANITDAGSAASKDAGAPGGLAELDENGMVLASQVPGSYAEIIEVVSHSALPPTGIGSRLYITTDTNKQYRWSGSRYVELSASLALGATAQSAHRGDHGEAAYNHSNLTSGNPHNVNYSDVGAASSRHAGNHFINGGDELILGQRQVVGLEDALSSKAALTHEHDAAYLSKTNTDYYQPTSYYHPATKKYVDDNIGGGGAVNFATSGNMLINPDFKINQRGFAGGAIAAGEYAVDRWGAPAGGASASFADGAVTLNSGKIRQVCEYALNAGDKLVFSFYAHNAAFHVELHSCDANGNVLASSGQKSIVTGAGKYCQQVFSAPAAGETVAVDIIKTNSASPIVKQLDLRFGEIAPAVWQPPAKGQEHTLCQRYYQFYPNLVTTGFITGATAYCGVQMSPMRAQPTVSGLVGKLINAIRAGGARDSNVLITNVLLDFFSENSHWYFRFICTTICPDFYTATAYITFPSAFDAEYSLV